METTNKTSVQNNKIIAEFMGCENPQAWEDDLYRYDWNWLMEVVMKIKASDFATLLENKSSIVFKECYDYERKIELCFEREIITIEAVYNACLEFIKWYNKQK